MEILESQKLSVSIFLGPKRLNKIKKKKKEKKKKKTIQNLLTLEVNHFSLFK